MKIGSWEAECYIGSQTWEGADLYMKKSLWCEKTEDYLDIDCQKDLIKDILNESDSVFFEQVSQLYREMHNIELLEENIKKVEDTLKSPPWLPFTWYIDYYTKALNKLKEKQNSFNNNEMACRIRDIYEWKEWERLRWASLEEIFMYLDVEKT
jgi:hypothetical protein